MKTKAKIISASVSSVILDGEIVNTIAVVTESGNVHSFTCSSNMESWESFPVIWEVTDD